MMFYKNTKAIVRSPNGDTDFFNIIARVLQRDTLLAYMFMICLDYWHRTLIDVIEENGFTYTKTVRNRRYPAESMTDAGYENDFLLLTNTPVQDEFQLKCLRQTIGSFGLYENINKT